ncbi:MAG: carbamoyltransferase [Candidatus Cloacimonetes bacterium]|nr:carbamoyltransferase [Candidatus Cloacimonadota bacterium]
MSGKATYTLGISAFYHDSAAALLKDGEILYAVQEERFTRLKHDASFPVQSILWCLQKANISAHQIEAIAFYDKPILKFERIIETLLQTCPKGYKNFLKSMPQWIKQKLFLKAHIKSHLREIDFDADHLEIIFPEHHLSHAASAFYPSPYKKAAIVTIDGVGEWATASICLGDGHKIKCLKQMNFPHSLGLFYSAFTYYCGFKVNSGEYKLMGLAPYADPNSIKVQAMINLIKQYLCDVKSDGSIQLNMKYFDFLSGSYMTKNKLWYKLFNFHPRKAESPINDNYISLAYAAQFVLEEAVCKLIQHALDITNCQNLVMSGGVALNCVANGKLLQKKVAPNIWIQPASNDSGGALGAAYCYWHIFKDQARDTTPSDSMKNSLLGPSFSQDEIDQMLSDKQAQFEEYSKHDDLCHTVAKLINDGNIIAWFQDQMEWGPRALGNRSILADPRNQEIQKKINLSVKFREDFRPFAPIVLEEYKDEYFNFAPNSPYMLFTCNLKPKWLQNLPSDFEKMTMDQKLKTKKSEFPAITHIDLSSRIQTVSKNSNPKIHKLLDTFHDLYDCPMLVNTSFNVRGEPIVLSPSDAYNCVLRTKIDYLVLGNKLLKRVNQPTPKNQQHFELD